MLRNLSPSSLQKAYDDCYMSCSTAVYFEKEGNESEAVLYWKRGLDQINEYHTTRVFSPNPRTDTERELLKSLKELEIQCKERIDLLEALRISRAEAAEDPSSGVGKWVDATRTEKGFIGEGTIPAVSYPDLARPSPQQRPPMHSRTSSKKGALSGSARSSLEIFRPNLTYAGTPRKESRSTSPDKPQYIMRTTLRSGKAQGTGKSSRRSAATPVEGPGANKAATIAWSKETGSRRSPLDVATSASTPALNETPDQSRRASGSINVQFDSHSRRLVPPRENDPEATTSRVPRGKKDPSNRKSIEEYSFPGPSLLSISAASSALNNHYSTDSPTAEIDFSRSSRTQKLRSAQKPPPGRVSYDRLYDPSHSPDNDLSDRRSIPLDIPMRRKPVGGNSEASSSANTPSRPNISKSSSSRPERRRLSRSSPSSYDDDTPKTRKRRSLTSSSRKQKDCSLLMDSPTKSPPQTPSDEDDLTQAEAKAWKRRKQQILRKLPPGVDEHAAKQILNEIVIQGDEVHWDDIAGLTVAKAALRETVVYPFLRPDLFMGLREPARGMLLFGPPGTGKTMLARAVATESASTFFSISASSLTSKYLGESEKLVRALFALAKTLAPSIIFVDEIDSLLSQRSGSGEHEATRRIKTEFLIQWSDLQRAAAGRDILEKDKERDNANRVLVLAATNMPWAIDEAARRRFVRRQYIPLPEPETRKVQFERLLEKQKHGLSETEIAELVEATEGFSGSDITALAKDAAMGPLRSLGEAVLTMSMDEIRPIGLEDFKASLKTIRPSVSPEGLKEYEEWARKFGERGG